MEQGSSKYVTGGPVDIPEDLNEREIAIKERAEGNKHLEEALKKCIEHGLQTRASCAGHPGLGSDPYLGIDITDETRKTIYSILNNHKMASMFTDMPKNPAYFEKEYFDEILKIDGDKGPRELLDKNIYELYRYYIDPKQLFEIDTKEDLREFNEMQLNDFLSD